MKRLMLLVLVSLFFSCCAKLPWQNMNNSANYQDSIAVAKDNGISPDEKRECIAYAYSVLDAYFSGKRPPAKTPRIKGYNTFFITLMCGEKLRGCQRGSAAKKDPQRTKSDIDQAIVRCIKDKRFGGVFTEDELNDAGIVFSVFYNKRQVRGKLRKKIELGVHAIEISQGAKRAFFKESVAITKNYNLKKLLQRLCKKAKLSPDAYTDPATKIYIYDTLTFKGNREGGIVDLYRYNPVLKVVDIDKELLYYRLGLAKSWFLNNIDKKTGILQYEYYPSTDKYSKGNNHVRQLACLWAIAALGEFFNDFRCRELAVHTLDYYLAKKVDKGNYCYIQIGKQGKLAFNAFLILTLIEARDYPNRDRLLKSLADSILYMQQEDGSFKTDYLSSRISGVDFYPGEAMLSLMMFYRESGEKAYLRAVEKAFPYYRNYWRGNKNTAFVPWQTEAYYALYLETKNPDLAAFIFEMSDWIIDKHQQKTGKYPDKIGGFPRGMPRNSTAVYLEGLNDAYSLAKMTGDWKRTEKYRQVIALGIRFVLLLQYAPGNSFYLKNRKRAIGGVRHSLERNNQRNDYTQHSTFALMKAYKNEIFKKK